MSVVARCAAATALAVVPVAGLATPAAADVSLQAQTTATGVHVVVTQQPAGSIITASLIDDAVGYAAGDFDSGGTSEALAAPAFPGRLVVQGPQLLCSELFSCPASPPSYPLLADASYPRRPNDTAQLSGSPMGSGPFVVTPASAHAHAGATSNSGVTSAGEMSLLTGTPGAIHIGANRATTTVQSTARSVHVVVESVVSDVDVAGTVHIGAIHARDDITVTAGHRPVDHPTITVTGVTAGGDAATIDQSGVHVAGNRGPSVAQQLHQAGTTIRAVGVHRDDTRTGGRSDATGIEVDVAVPVSGVPYIPNPVPTLPPPFDQVPALPGVDANGTYIAHVTLGAVGAAAGLGTEPTFPLSSFGKVPTPASHSAAGPTGGGGQTGGGTTSFQAGGTPANLPQPAPQLAPPPASGLRAILDGLSAGEIEAIYAVLALGGVALFIGWRSTVVLGRRLRWGWRQR